jgi:hypothetical protein
MVAHRRVAVKAVEVYGNQDGNILGGSVLRVGALRENPLDVVL